MRRKIADHDAVIQDMAGQGRSDYEIAEKTGFSHYAIQRYRKRTGIHKERYFVNTSIKFTPLPFKPKIQPVASDALGAAKHKLMRKYVGVYTREDGLIQVGHLKLTPERVIELASEIS